MTIEELTAAQPIATVYFEDTGEARVVVRYCRRCAAGPEGGEEVEVVSPSGIAHCGGGDGWSTYSKTKCGIEATGDDWWWRL